jgi:glutamate decarboxylase
LSNIHRKLGTTKGPAQALTDTIAGFDEDDAEYYERGLPVVSFRFTDKFRQEYPNVKQVWIQNLLRAKQWIGGYKYPLSILLGLTFPDSAELCSPT